MNERIEQLIREATTIEYGVDNGFDHTTFDKEKFAELIIQTVLTLQNRHGNIKPKKVREHFGVQDPDVPTEDEAKAAYERLVAIGIIRPNERTLEGAEKEAAYEVIQRFVPYAITNNQRSITEEYLILGIRYELHWFGEDDYMIVEINK